MTQRLDCFTYILLLCLLLWKVLLISGLKVAVFEHAQQMYALSPQFRQPADVIQANLEYYQRAADFAASKGVKVIVFPEHGIIPSLGSRAKVKSYLEYIPDPKKNRTIPCDDLDGYKDRRILYTLSCIAKKNKMVLVANTGDIQPCEGQKDCPKDGAFQYNTNVAFDENGTLLARYHKEHLYGENAYDVPPNGQDPTFKTSLGRFATFVCFDIIFKKIVEVARYKDMKAILFTTMWLNSSPLFNAIQFQESWARGNNVTLLAANVHLPGLSGIGSGIYKGREGAQVFTFNPDGNSKLLVTNLEWSECSQEQKSSIYVVHKNRTEVWHDEGRGIQSNCSRKLLGAGKDVYKDYRCFERGDMTNFTLTKLVKPRDKLTSCQNGVCCELEYSAEEIQESFYLGVFNGSYSTTRRYSFAEENCLLVRCDSLREKPCVTFPMQSQTVFYEIKLRANFSSDYIYPSMMESGMRLTPSSQWTYDSKGTAASLSFKNSTGKHVLVAGLKARAYDRDPPYIR